MNGLKRGVEWTDQETIQWESIQQKRTFTLAFSGHFSSGKSTLLNELIGAPLLPTSPIPTSANQVYIGFGELGVDVEKVSGELSRYVGEIDWNDIRRYGMDGVGIQKLHIKAPIPFLQHSAELVDTPGVDSTDSTHQAMTMDALFTTDAVVYVMDYNHVKAETNLHFLKQLSDEAKPLLLVINQIDKHVEQELLFQTYKESITQTLEAWGIKYLSIYYTSMRAAEYNELSQLKTELIAIMAKGKTFAELGKKRLERSFYLTQIRRIKETEEEEEMDLRSTIEELGFSIDDLHTYEQNIKEWHELEHASKNREKAFLADWNSLFRQATLFNSAITDLTQEWLEAMRPNFRVGVLFSKRKTEEEKERRTKLLVTELQDQVQSQLVFHVQRSLQTIPVEFMDKKEAFLTALNQISFEVNTAFLKHSLPKETVGREYVYQYAQNRSEEIKRILKQRALEALNIAQDNLKKEDQANWVRAKKELENQSNLVPYIDRWTQMKKEVNGQIDYLKKQAKACDDYGKLEFEVKAVLQNATEYSEESNWVGSEEIKHPETLLDSEVHHVQESFVKEENAIDLKGLQEILEGNQQKQWGKEWRERLTKRLKQMEMQRFTISLFGAFSAGKSSFANALIGDEVLPTSPHPTTAAVTTVTASMEGFPHGTVVITYKSYQHLEEELTSISKLVSVKLTPDNIRNIRISTIKADTAGKKQAIAYLKTLQESLKNQELLLATTKNVTLDQLASMIANEDVACLIAEAKIYYDCQLTKAGLTLVDTPGVNSIHGRHTNVAYTHIEKSDAIFYVTYYNHSFSKADAQFIEQLGKINQQFSTKQLYFILNAVDLAANPAELAGVESYVRTSLQSAGVNDVLLYPVSSKAALMNKKNELQVGAGFQLFENELYGQMLQTLRRLNEQLLLKETTSYRNYLEEMIQFSQANKESQQALLESTKINFERLLNEFIKEEGQPFLLRIHQEVSELFTYLRERNHFVLRDTYLEHVNVATVRGATKKQQKETVEQGLKQWREEGVFFLEQEVKATAIRLSLSFQRHYERWIREWEQSIQQVYPAFYLGEFNRMKLTLQLEPVESELNLDSYNKRFLSLKSFFEQGESARVKEEVSFELAKEMGEFLRQQEEKVKTQVATLIEEITLAEKTHIKSKMNHEEEKLAILSEPAFAKEMYQEKQLLERWFI